MSKLTFKEIVEHYKSLMTYNDFAKGIHNERDLGFVDIVLEEASALIGNAKKIIWFEEHDVYIKIIGYYEHFEDKVVYIDDTNHIGWISLKEVRPFEIIKTTYKEIK